MITDEQAKEYAMKLSEYFKEKKPDDCCSSNCSIGKVYGKDRIIKDWLDLLKEDEQK